MDKLNSNWSRPVKTRNLMEPGKTQQVHGGALSIVSLSRWHSSSRVINIAHLPSQTESFWQQITTGSIAQLVFGNSCSSMRPVTTCHAAGSAASKPWKEAGGRGRTAHRKVSSDWKVLDVFTSLQGSFYFFFQTLDNTKELGLGIQPKVYFPFLIKLVIPCKCWSTCLSFAVIPWGKHPFSVVPEKSGGRSALWLCSLHPVPDVRKCII